MNTLETPSQYRAPQFVQLDSSHAVDIAAARTSPARVDIAVHELDTIPSIPIESSSSWALGHEEAPHTPSVKTSALLFQRVGGFAHRFTPYDRMGFSR
jgi:hypothetical protein